MAASSHFDLLNARRSATTKEEQNAISPYEHRAYARETVAEDPLMAISIGVATPAYQAAKVVGAIGSRSDASLSQIKEGFVGIGEGLALAAKKPWEEAQEQASSVIQTVKKTVGKLLPWEEAAKPQPPKVITKAKYPDKFEEVFTKLIKQESGGKHEVNGKLLTSPVGAAGVTQVMPKTGVDPGYGVAPLKNKSKEEYIRFGRDYLKAMLGEFNGDYRKALAAYNFGPGSVKAAIEKANGGDWLRHTPKETRDYVRNIHG